MRRFALYALAAVLLGATAPGVPWFTPTQALDALQRDDSTVRACVQRDPKGMRSALTIRAIASKPRLALVQIQNSCDCGAQNCPFWIYRVTSGGPKLVLADVGITISTVSRASGPPDIVTLAHDSALVSDGTRYAFKDGTYVAADSWRVRGDTGARKPLSVQVKFLPGTSSAQLSGNVSLGWNDVYTFAAFAGQRLSISSARPLKTLDVELYAQSNGGQPVPVHADGRAVVLPLTGTYQLTVDTGASDGSNVQYALTLAIH